MSLSHITSSVFPISQIFGNKLIIDGKDFYAQFGLAGHNGIDYATPENTPLLASVDGVCTVQNDGKVGYGLYVRINKTRPDGVTQVLYGHLNSVCVQTGETVSVGQVIGYSGGCPSSPTSGDSLGAHVHFGMRWFDTNGHVISPDNGYGGWQNPLGYFV